MRLRISRAGWVCEQWSEEIVELTSSLGPIVGNHHHMPSGAVSKTYLEYRQDRKPTLVGHLLGVAEAPLMVRPPIVGYSETEKGFPL